MQVLMLTNVNIVILIVIKLAIYGTSRTVGYSSHINLEYTVGGTFSKILYCIDTQDYSKLSVFL